MFLQNSLVLFAKQEICLLETKRSFHICLLFLDIKTTKHLIIIIKVNRPAGKINMVTTYIEHCGNEGIIVLVFKLLLDRGYLKKFDEGISEVLEKCSNSNFSELNE